MLIGFVGAPISGKTTTAARLFASLKDDGYAAEFIPEQARVRIATKRLTQPDVPLDDTDQARIFKAQALLEDVFVASSPSSLVVADATAFLALLYMTPGLRLTYLDLAKKSVGLFDILFRCRPVHAGVVYDPNRMHSFEQSVKLDALLDEILVTVGSPKVIELVGDTRARANHAMTVVMERMCRF